MQTLILNYYPPVIKRIKEMQQIAKAEDVEFSKLHASIGEVSRNMFVNIADETGVSRFENILGITPKPGQSMESRKIYILFMMNQKKTTLSELKTMLASYCEDVEFVCDISNMEMIVEMSAGTVDINAINDILEEILPVNIYFHFKTMLETERAKAETYALHRMGSKLKVKAFVQESLKSETEVGGKIKAYQKSRQTLKIKKGGHE